MVVHAHKTALVTGACGGLGRAIAEKFLQEGAKVIVCDVNDQLIEDFTQKVSAAYPECTLVLKVDVTDDAALDHMFSQAEQRFGQVDYVVNNCGIMDKFDPAGDLERSLWDRVIAVNLTAPAMVTKRAINMMLKHGVKGSIVNIASIAGVRGFCSGTNRNGFRSANPVVTDELSRCCVHCQQTWYHWPHEEYRRLLRRQGHQVQCHHGRFVIRNLNCTCPGR